VQPRIAAESIGRRPLAAGSVDAPEGIHALAPILWRSGRVARRAASVGPFRLSILPYDCTGACGKSDLADSPRNCCEEEMWPE
jgi:hypothetical protein